MVRTGGPLIKAGAHVIRRESLGTPKRPRNLCSKGTGFYTKRHTFGGSKGQEPVEGVCATSHPIYGHGDHTLPSFLTLGDGSFVNIAGPWIQPKLRPCNTKCSQIASPKATRLWKKGDTFANQQDANGRAGSRVFQHWQRGHLYVKRDTPSVRIKRTPSTPGSTSKSSPILLRNAGENA